MNGESLLEAAQGGRWGDGSYGNAKTLGACLLSCWAGLSDPGNISYPRQTENMPKVIRHKESPS
jgi:hypothetical protein